MSSPASQLEGLEVDGGWIVGPRLMRLPGQTGGNFSEGYPVSRSDGTRAFLKALDYSAAMKAPDPARALQRLTEAYNFERDLLARCRSMDRVVRALADGSASINGQVVQYLIFELADHDIRKYLDLAERFDTAWLLRALHHIATGLRQLHGAGIAHQDLKPSNVLVFAGQTSKVADLGRASSRGTLAPHEEYQIAGDPQYAPPELLYGYVDPEWTCRRMGCDAYHLGSMVVFLFGRANMTALLFSQMDETHHPNRWGGTFQEALPYLRQGYERALHLFKSDLSGLRAELRDELMAIVRHLCDPDPALRGDPKARSGANQYSLERYVTRFDLLARRAEIGLLG
jgi:serine/threonine protein kinase